MHRLNQKCKVITVKGKLAAQMKNRRTRDAPPRTKARRWQWNSWTNSPFLLIMYRCVYFFQHARIVIGFYHNVQLAEC